MNKATLHLVLEAKDLVTPALERVRERARSAGQEGGRAARGLDGLQRAGKGLAPAADSMERLRNSLAHMARELPDAARRSARAFAELRQQALDPGLRSMDAMQQGARRLRQSLAQAVPAATDTAARPQRFAAGGVAFRRLPQPLITSGSGSEDDVPALLMRGEFVLRKAAVQRYGLDFLHALNAMKLPAVNVPAVPRLASGGAVARSLVLPQHYMDVVPRFAMGGHAYIHPKAEYSWREVFPSQPPGARIIQATAWDDRRIQSFVNAKVQGLASKLNLQQLNNAPHEYLSDVLGVAVNSVRVFAKGGSANNVDAELKRKKELLNKDYGQRIAQAKAEGNEEIAALLEEQRLELEMLIEELRANIEDFAEEYRQSMQDMLDEYEGTVEALRKEYGKSIAGLKSEQQSLSRYSFFNYERDFLSRKIATLSNRYYSQEGRENQRLERSVNAENRMLQRLGDRDERRSFIQGRQVERESRLALRRTWLEYTHRIQDLEMDWKKALQELDDTYGTTSITGFKHWLAKGGPVGFARGGQVPTFSWAAPDRDSVPAMLTPGEFVLRKDAAQALGRTTLERLNSLGGSIHESLQPVLRFAAGGQVPGSGLAGSLATAGAPVGGEWGTLNIQVGGASHQVMAQREVARALRKHLSKAARSTS